MFLVGQDRKKNPRIPASFDWDGAGIGTLLHNVKLPLCYYAPLQIWSPRILLSRAEMNLKKKKKRKEGENNNNNNNRS